MIILFFLGQGEAYYALHREEGRGEGNGKGMEHIGGISTHSQYMSHTRNACLYIKLVANMDTISILIHARKIHIDRK